MTTPRYRQADPKWSAEVLGNGPSTIGRGGCLLVCLCEAARLLRGVEFLPSFLNQAGIERKAFIHSLAITDQLGAIAGLRVDKKTTGGIPELRGAIGEALRTGGLSIAHVDHSGDMFGDHFVLVHTDGHDASGNKRLTYADPATGRDAELNANTLDGITVWGTKPKRYRVRSVRSVHLA